MSRIHAPTTWDGVRFPTGSWAEAVTIPSLTSLTSLLGRVAAWVTATATAPVDNRSRRNAKAAVALDRVRAGARTEAARAFH